MGNKVIIIGAGIAGLSAAVQLAGKGFIVKIFEARKNIGGRMFAFTHTATGEMIDNGQHIISGAYTEFLSLLDELGTSQYLKSSDGLKVHFALPDNKKYVLDTSSFQGNLGIIAGLLKFEAIALSSKFQLISFFIKLKFRRIKPDGLSCYDLLKNEHQSDEIIHIFWEPLILAVMNARPEDIAATLLLEVLQRAFFAGGKSSDLLLSTRELTSLLQPFTKWLTGKGGEINLHSPVESILVENGKARGIVLKNGDKFCADTVISTVQARTLYKLIPAVSQKVEYEYLSKFSYSTIINIYYWLDQHIETPDFTAMLGTNSQWMFNRRNFIAVPTEIKTKYPGMLNITISGANDLAGISSARLAAGCFDEVKSCFSEFSEVEVLHSEVIKDKYATFATSLETEKLRPEPTGLIASLLIAGDWTNTGLPATIESAAVSGKKTAEFLK